LDALCEALTALLSLAAEPLSHALWVFTQLSLDAALVKEAQLSCARPERLGISDDERALSHDERPIHLMEAQGVPAQQRAPLCSLDHLYL
jgi:hypothetical protein